MARKRSEIEPMRPDLPVYPIGVAARLLNVHPRTLRIYESEGLIKPSYHGSRRMFSADDIKWIECLRSMIHDQGISIQGMKKLLNLAPCWEIASCPAEVHKDCGAAVDRAAPRTPHEYGDEEAAREAKAEEQSKKGTGKKEVQKKKLK